jgi:RHS repeat-associated protein
MCHHATGCPSKAAGLVKGWSSVARRRLVGRGVGLGVVLVVVGTGAWVVSSNVVASAASAVLSSPVTYRYDPEDPRWWGMSAQAPVSLSEDGMSVGFLSVPNPPGFARQDAAAMELEDEGVYSYGVADASADGEERELRLMQGPGYVLWHPGESQLSGDGLTYVATYLADSVSLGACSYDADPGTPDALYWSSQVLRWQRPDRSSEFGDPELVSVSDPTECDGVPADLGPPLDGIGGDDTSRDPTVSDDGSVVAFSSAARNLSAAPTASVAGLFVAEEGTGGQLEVEMVTPASLNGNVWDPMVSGDGDRIVFVSDASGLVTGVSPPAFGSLVYVATRGTGSWSFEVASKSTSGALASANGDGVWIEQPTIDADGDRVAFTTTADNLDPTVSMPAEGPVVVVRDLSAGTTRVAVDQREPDGGLLHGQRLGVSAPRAHISRDGHRVATFGQADSPSKRNRLLVFDVDAALDSDAADRRDARRFSRNYSWNANQAGHVVIEGEPATDPEDPAESYVAVFPSDSPPNSSFSGYGSALYFAGGGGLGPDVARGWHGDPVDTATGAFRQDEVDLPAPPGAGSATIGRSHTSVGEPGGIFGPGWSSALDEHLELDEDGTAVLIGQNGQHTVFARDGATVDGSRLVLAETIDGWSITGPDGSRRAFDEAGQLTGWVQPGAPTTTIQWSGPVPISLSTSSGYDVELVDDTAYQLVWDPVTETFSSEPTSGSDGLIDRIVSSDGRQVDYGYELDAREATRLVSVSRPHAVGQPAGTFGVRTYEWHGAWISTIVDQVDATRTKVVVENTYDAAGRVTHQVTDTGDELDFAYGQKPDPFGVLIDADGFTTVTNAASGDVTVYEYNDIGEVIGVTDATGNTTTRSWATDRPDAATSRTGVATEYVYDDAERVEAVTETAGATTRTVETLTYVTADTSPAALTDDRVATHTDEAGVTTTYTYDGSVREPETVSVPCDPDSTDPSTPCPGSGKATTTYTYFSGSLAGLVESVTDPDGVVTEYTYAADRSVATTTTYDGATPLTTSYETVRVGDPGWAETNPAAVEVRTTETPGGAVTTELYDAEGRVIESRDPLYDGTTHLATIYEYSLDGELVSVTDPGGAVTTHAVARAGDPGWAEGPEIAEVRTATGPDGVSSITKSDRSGDIVVEQHGDPAVPGELATTTHVYGELGRLESTTDPMGVTTTYTYDVEGRVTEVIDEDGEKTITDYDDFGRPTVVTDPLGETTTTTYGSDGRVASVEDREGHDTTFTYDDAGRPHTTTDARSGVTERQYTPAGRLASETDATGRTTSYHHDSAGRQTEVELPSGATTTTTYDEDGRIETVTSPEGRLTSYTYDDLGRVETVADPRTGTTTTTYWPTGEVKTRTDATGGEVAYSYDGGGRVVTVTDPLTRVTTYDYDSRGNRTMRTDAKSGEREWHWNLADQIVETVDPLDRSTTYTYDDLGRLDVKTDGAARTETYGYDEAGQVTSVTYASGTPTTFEYDGEGRRTKMIDATGTSLWHYNATGQVTGADLPGSRDLAFAWDLAGRRTVIDYPDGTRYRNRYDTDGRLGEVEFDDAGTWVDVAVNTYDDDGLLVEQDQGTSGLREWTYDAVTGRLTEYDETRGLVTTSTALTHDAAGRIASETTGGVSTGYDYDDAGQLTLVDRSTGSDETYAYDELGRRTTAVVGATTTTYQWDAASQLTRRVVNGANHNYQYDTSGRRTREAWNGGTNVLQWFWGARGTMTGQRYTEPGTVTDTARATRGDGTLATLVTTVNSVTTDTTSIVWDPTMAVPQPVWTGDPGTSNATRAVYGPDLIGFSCPTGTNCTGSANHDVHGSALSTTATSATTQDTAYTPWGDGGGTFTVGANHGYRSELHTGATVHLRARDYDPETGLFLSPDPLDGVDGTTTVDNPYHYTDNDPLNSTDPTGLRPDDDEMNCGAGEQLAQGTGTTNDIYTSGEDAYSSFCRTVGGGDLCFARRGNCTSFISQWTDGDFCSAWHDDECTAIKTSHPGLYQALLVTAGAAVAVVICTAACPAAAAIAIPTGGLAALPGVTVPAGVMVIAVSQGALIGASATLAGLGVYMASGGTDTGGGSQQADPPPDPTVKEVLKTKKGSIRQADLPEGSPSWDDILDLRMSQIMARARARVPGYQTIRKLLTDSRFNK